MGVWLAKKNPHSERLFFLSGRTLIDLLYMAKARPGYDWFKKMAYVCISGVPLGCM